MGHRRVVHVVRYDDGRYSWDCDRTPDGSAIDNCLLAVRLNRGVQNPSLEWFDIVERKMTHRLSLAITRLDFERGCSGDVRHIRRAAEVLGMRVVVVRRK